MRINRLVVEWLESRWVSPSYSGLLLLGLSVFFFIAASNTLSGWLYVLSGIGLALLAIAAFLSRQSLKDLQIQREAIHPVSAGDRFTVELIIQNSSNQPKALFQVQDILPANLGDLPSQSIELIPANQAHHWIYTQPAPQRGIYRWRRVQVRTANPLGLFWSRKIYPIKAVAVVFPTVLPLSRCPLIDEIGRESSLQLNSDRRAQAASEGLTRSIRPYRWGDPTRLVHWRTSARYGELRVRELELFTGGQTLIIGLDSASRWQQANSATESPDFEQAVIAAASLYFYARHQQLNVQLWTAATGVVQGEQAVLETLAGTQPGEAVSAEHLPQESVIWLTQNLDDLNTLPTDSRWILWTGSSGDSLEFNQPTLLHRPRNSGIMMNTDHPLQQQLQGMPIVF